MDLENIRAFVKVVHFGSLTKAAANLGLPKSTVSRRLAELETQLGARLLQRTTRRMSLTEAGQRLFDQTERQIAELELAGRAVAHSHDAPSGTLRVTTPTDLANSELMQVVESFLIKYPDVKLVWVATNRRVDLVAEGVDLALRAGPLPASGLHARKLNAGELQLFASERYLTRRGEPERVEQLADHDCLVFSNEQTTLPWRLHSTEHPDQVREVVVSGRCAISDYGALASACSAGLGIALLPTSMRPTHGPHSKLRRVLPGWCGPDPIFHAVYPSATQLSKAVRAFIEHVAVYF